MKKLLYVFETMIAIIVFTMGFSNISQDQFDDTSNFFFLLSKDQQQELVSLNIMLDTNQAKREANLEVLENILEKEGCIAMIPIGKQGDNMLVESINYLYAPKGYTIPNINLRNNKHIDFSSHTDLYYSNHLSDKNRYDTIDYIDKNYNKDYQNLIQIKQLLTLSEGNDFIDEAPIYIISNHPTSTLDALFDSEIGSIFEKNEDFETLEFSVHHHDNVLSNKLIVFSAMAVFILLCCEILKSKKEIVIRKMFGAKAMFIFNRMYRKDILISILLYPCIQGFLYGIRIGNIRLVQYPFIEYLLKCFLFYALAMVFAGIAIYVIVRFTNDYKSMKKQGNSNLIPYFSLLLKMTFIILIVTPMLSIYREASTSIQTLWLLKSHKAAFLNTNYISGIANYGSHMDFSEAISLMEAYVIDYGGIYQDFHKNSEAEELQAAFPNGVIPQYEVPYIVVNKAYLQQYDVKLTNGSSLDLDSLHGDVLLVPEKHKDISTELYCEVTCSETIEVANHQTYYNRNAFEYEYSDLMKQDPIILVSEQIAGKNWSNFYFDVSSKKEREKLQHYIEKNHLENLVYFESTNTLYQNAIERNSDLAIQLVFMTIVYIFLLLIFIFQSIYIDFYEHKEEFAINYLMGKHHWQRHKPLYLKSLFVYMITFVILWMNQNIPLYSLIKFGSIMILLDILFTYMIIRTLEHHKIIAILKGEN